MTGFDASTSPFAGPSLPRPSSQLVTVFGGSGFLGRHVVRALAKRGYRIRVAVRRPDLALFLQPLGKVGQIVAVQANLRYPDSIARAVEGADAVVNLVGILQETGRQGFLTLQAEGAGEIAVPPPQSARPWSTSRPSGRTRIPTLSTRARRRWARRRCWRPSPGLWSCVPPGLRPRRQLLQSFRVARPRTPGPAPRRSRDALPAGLRRRCGRGRGPRGGRAGRGGRVYELGGPEVETLDGLVRYMLKTTRRRRLVVDVPKPIAMLQARVIETVDTLSLGLLPDSLKLTRDQVTLLQTDNVVSEAAKAEGRTLDGLGILPTAMAAIVPGYLWTFRKAGQFSKEAFTASEEEAAEPSSPPVARPSGPPIGPDAAAPSRMGVRWGTRG